MAATSLLRGGWLGAAIEVSQLQLVLNAGMSFFTFGSDTH